MINLSMQKVLNTKMIQPNSAKASTVKEYLRKLLLAVWEKGEVFDGKRAFGNSDWQKEIIYSLANIEDVDDDLDDALYAEYHKTVIAAIRYLML